MYSAALTAIRRHSVLRRCSYASRSAFATNDVQTRFGVQRGTTIVRVCQGKLYPQHQYEVSGDRSAISLSIIPFTRFSWENPQTFFILRSAVKKSAIAFGF